MTTTATKLCRNGHRMDQANRYVEPRTGYMRCHTCRKHTEARRVGRPAKSVLSRGPYRIPETPFLTIVKSTTCSNCHGTGRVYGDYGVMPGIGGHMDGSGQQRRLVDCEAKGCGEQAVPA